MDIFDAILAANLDEALQIIAADPAAVNRAADTRPAMDQLRGVIAGLTPLHVAACLGQIDMIHLLHQHGGQINAVATSLTPLHYAIAFPTAEGSFYNVVKVLLDAGAEIAPDTDILLDAVRYHDSEVVGLLLKHGANLDYEDTDNDSMTAMHDLAPVFRTPY